MSEDKKKKASRNYNTKKMTYDLLGKTFQVHLEAVMADNEGNDVEAFILNDAQLRSVLIGYSNMVNDSVASLTKDSGFTDEQRLERMLETHENIDSGTYKKERAERAAGVKIDKNAARAMIDLVEIRVMAKLGLALTEEQEDLLSKEDPDFYQNVYLQKKPR